MEGPTIHVQTSPVRGQHEEDRECHQYFNLTPLFATSNFAVCVYVVVVVCVGLCVFCVCFSC